MCCESQLPFKKQTPNIFEDNILLPLNQTLHYPRSIFFNQVWTTKLYMKESKYPLPSWTTVWFRFLRPLALHRKNWPENCNRRRAMCRHTFQMLKQMGGTQRLLNHLSPVSLICETHLETLPAMHNHIHSIKLSSHLTKDTWLVHGDRVLLNLISFTGKESN